jgi:hypothetical protein
MSFFKHKVKDRIKELELDIIKEYTLDQINNSPIRTFKFAFKECLSQYSEHKTMKLWCFRNNKAGEKALCDLFDRYDNDKSQPNKSKDYIYTGNSKDTFNLLCVYLGCVDELSICFVTNTNDKRHLMFLDVIHHLKTKDKKWAIFNCQNSDNTIKFICKRIFRDDYVIL